MVKTTKDLLTFFPSDHNLGSSFTGQSSMEGFSISLSGSTGHSFDEQVDILDLGYETARHSVGAGISRRNVLTVFNDSRSPGQAAGLIYLPYSMNRD
jgi:hypothetical protein